MAEINDTETEKAGATADETKVAPTTEVEAMPDGAGPGRTGELEAEVTRLKDQLLRALAEQENIRRRTVKEREDGLRYATSGLAKDLLSVADNLRRALDSMPESQINSDVLRNLLTGVAATERELLQAFEKNSIQKLDPIGEKFDHNLHQAIVELENTGQPAGTVVQVLQSGYLLHDRLLREAMVAVSKGEVAAKGDAVAESEGDSVAKPDGETIRRVDTTA
jgi:molecular chaperone GrpE